MLHGYTSHARDWDHTAAALSDRYRVLANVALVAQHDQARGGQLADDASDPGSGQVMHRAGQRPGHPHDLPVGAGDDFQVRAVPVVLGVARWNSRVIGYAVTLVTDIYLPFRLAS
jgi:hypothetical protein